MSLAKSPLGHSQSTTTPRSMPPQVEAGMPPERRALMPAQNLRQKPAIVRTATRQSRLWRRLAVAGSALLLTGWAASEMYAVLAISDMTILEWVLLGLFVVTFGWIALAFTTAIAGFGVVVRQAGRPPRRLHQPLTSRTAVLMPTYNESPARLAAALEAMIRSVAAEDESEAFDWIILSDTQNATIARQEQGVVIHLRHRLRDLARIHYRRRYHNVARKSGNVQDFCERWGSQYDFLLVLDADSLIEGATMVEMARRMEREPDIGLLQTIPRLIGGTTLLARLQQFAGRIYGPIVGSGLAWWVQDEGNFWGHNAIIRSQAFIKHAGLPTLPGKAPFGGHILSHDFVEAALLRRAGWRVVIADDLAGSFEESPPSIVDMAVRDRRWCQGNLQHSKVVSARGLHWISRFHMVNGIFSYLSSLLWLALIVTGLALSLQYQFIRPEYFPDNFSLFPKWPVMDSARALTLFGVTIGVLLGPKILGVIAFLCHGRARRAAGGSLAVVANSLFEILLSALIAPIMMLIHCGAIGAILIGKDSGWAPQRRNDGSLPWRGLIYRHRWHMAMGIILTIASGVISTELLAWLAPAIIGMLLAVPLSAITGSRRIGAWCQRFGLLRIPAERIQPPVQLAMLATLDWYQQVVERTPDLAATARSPWLTEMTVALTDTPPQLPRGEVDALTATAAVKIAQAHDSDEAVSFLDEREQLRVQGRPELMLALAHKASTSMTT